MRKTVFNLPPSAKFILLLPLVGLFLLTGCASQNASAPKTPGTPDLMKAAFWPPYPDEPRVQFLVSFLLSKELEPSRSKMDDLVYGKEKEDIVVINKPYGVRMWHGRIYVCDIRGNNCVVILDIKNKQTLMMGKTGSETLQDPRDIAIADDGFKYVADIGRSMIVVFDDQDRSVNLIGHKDFKPVSVATYKNELYAADFFGKHIEVFDRHTGQLLRTIGGPGKEIGQFIEPIGVAVDKQGFVYVMDVMTTRLTKFDPTGKPIVGYFGTITARVGGLVRPKHIAVDDQGILYVVDAAFSNVQMFDQDGHMLTFFGSAGPHPGSMQLPVGICLDSEDVGLFKQFIHPAFDAKQLIVVTNQFGPRRVAVYALGQLKPGKTVADISASKGVVGMGVNDAKHTPTSGPAADVSGAATQPGFVPPLGAPFGVPAPTTAPSATPDQSQLPSNNIPSTALPSNSTNAPQK